MVPEEASSLRLHFQSRAELRLGTMSGGPDLSLPTVAVVQPEEVLT